jgi:hypothetical protein
MLASRRFAPTEVRCAGAYSAERMANDDGRDELPDGGWDQVIRWAHEDRMIGRVKLHCPGVRGTVKPLAHIRCKIATLTPCEVGNNVRFAPDSVAKVESCISPNFW